MGTKDHCRPITQCCNHPCKIYIFNGKQRFQLMLGTSLLSQRETLLHELGVAPNSSNQLTLVFKNMESQDKLDAAIQQAGWDGDAGKVEQLLSEGADPNSYDGSKGN